jgi:hypothetical protein
MRENDGSAFALVDKGHSPALDFQELLSSERLCAVGYSFSPLEHSESVIQDLLGTVGRDAWGVLDDEAVPRVAGFLVWLDLTDLEASAGFPNVSIWVAFISISSLLYHPRLKTA